LFKFSSIFRAADKKKGRLSANMATTTAQYMSQKHQQQQQQQQPQQSDPSFLSAQAALNIEDSPPIRVVQIAALVLVFIDANPDSRSL
jgi:hypothetical protein